MKSQYLRKLLKIRAEDEEYVKRRTAELAAEAEMAAKERCRDTAKEMAKTFRPLSTRLIKPNFKTSGYSYITRYSAHNF